MSLTYTIQQYLKEMKIGTILLDNELTDFARQVENENRLKLVKYLYEKKSLVTEGTIVKDLQLSDTSLLGSYAPNPFCPFFIGLIKEEKLNKRYLSPSEKTRFIIPEKKLDDAKKYIGFMTYIMDEVKAGA